MRLSHPTLHLGLCLLGPPGLSYKSLEGKKGPPPTACRPSRRNAKAAESTEPLSSHLEQHQGWYNRARPSPALVYLSFWPAQSSPVHISILSA